MCGGGESSSLPCPCQVGSLSRVKAKSVSGQRYKGLLNAAACTEKEREKKRDRLKMGSKTSLSASKEYVAPGCVNIHCFFKQK